MTVPGWVTLTISFLTDFIITAGTTVSTVMVASSSTALPSKATWIMATIGGLVAAARRVQALVAPPTK